MFEELYQSWQNILSWTTMLFVSVSNIHNEFENLSIE